ncbi:winged helix-turn-helix domain-containing protein [Nostoc sp.]|uniref:winged helix-turn-helix domain-containing protein n=1 Tax=Nostoc sp. TaxID=1180 RepID=UPI003FA55065
MSPTSFYLISWLKDQFNIDCCRYTVCKTLKRWGFSWKKACKLLNKANPKRFAIAIGLIS